MKVGTIRWGILCGLLAFAPSALALQDQKPVALARTYKVGDVNRYKLTMNAALQVGEAVIKQTMKTTVKEVRKNGDVVLQQESELGSVVVGGEEQNIGSIQPMLLTYTKLGRLLEFKQTGLENLPIEPEVLKTIASINDALFPEKPVAPEGTWTTDIDNPWQKGKKFQVKSTFAGLDKVDDVDLWKIRQTGEVDTATGSDKATFELTLWLNPGNGQTVKAEGSVKDIPTGYGPMSWTVKMALVKPDQDKKTQ